MVQTLGFEIFYHGDESVGLFPEGWQLKGHYRFENQDEYQKFVNELMALYELISDTPLEIKPIAYRVG